MFVYRMMIIKMKLVARGLFKIKKAKRYDLVD